MAYAGSMVNRSGKKMPPVRIKQRPNQGEVLQGLHQVFIDLLRTELDTALVLARLSHNRVRRGFRERAREMASGVCIAILTQLSEMRIGSQDRLWVEKRLKEIECLLIQGLLKESPNLKNLS
jgi:hypothetical protein